MKVTVLGCGASSGVPLIGCRCVVCTSDNPKNKRTRASILIESNDTTILIDTSPDMRAQFLRHGISKVDAIIYTHAHADHLHGIDDIRCLNFLNNSPMPVYCDEVTLSQIKQTFGYVFTAPKPSANALDWGWYRPCLSPTIVTEYVPFKIADIKITPFYQKHGTGKTLGLRFGTFAYSTDVNGLPEESLQILEGVDTWIVDCLRKEPAPTHADLSMTLGWIERIKPRQAYLTHMNHGFEYDALAAELPKGVLPAYDGLELTIP